MEAQRLANLMVKRQLRNNSVHGDRLLSRHLSRPSGVEPPPPPFPPPPPPARLMNEATAGAARVATAFAATEAAAAPPKDLFPAADCRSARALALLPPTCDPWMFLGELTNAGFNIGQDVTDANFFQMDGVEACSLHFADQVSARVFVASFDRRPLQLDIGHFRAMSVSSGV